MALLVASHARAVGSMCGDEPWQPWVGLAMGKLMGSGWAAHVQSRAGLLSVLACWVIWETSLGCSMLGKSMAGLHIGGDRLWGYVTRFERWHWHRPSPSLCVHWLRLCGWLCAWAARWVCMACGGLEHVHKLCTYVEQVATYWCGFYQAVGMQIWPWRCAGSMEYLQDSKQLVQKSSSKLWQQVKRP